MVPAGIAPGPRRRDGAHGPRSGALCGARAPLVGPRAIPPAGPPRRAQGATRGGGTRHSVACGTVRHSRWATYRATTRIGRAQLPSYAELADMDTALSRLRHRFKSG